MTNALLIFRRNADTFYDYRTNTPYSLRKRYIAIAGVSAFATFFFRGHYADLYTGFLAVQAILVGFSFNLIFYLSSDGYMKLSSNGFIEDDAEIKRLNKLGKEIFYNISYFNFVSVLSVILATLLLMSPAFKPIECYELSHNACKLAIEFTNVASTFMWILILFSTYFCVIESMLTFVRAIRRVNSYFEDKMILVDKGAI